MALIVILVWYLGIGVLAAIGTVTISRARFTPRVERIFFALVLIPIAAVYLAFVDHFHTPAVFRLEGYAALLFSAVALLGLRFPTLLILSYAAHGAWDLVHEIVVHTSLLPETAGQLTPIPLAYGAFCASFDWAVAAYFFTRLPVWRSGTR